MDLAKCIEEENPGCLKGIKILSGLNEGHAEAQLHGLVREWGLTLDVKISYVKRGLLTIPLIRVSSWFEYLLAKKPEVLLGGRTVFDDSLKAFLASFWAAYKEEDPGHDVFRFHQTTLDHCIPFYLYADEGRGHRKSPVQIWAMEAVFGTSSTNQTKKCNSVITHLDSQVHTGKGNSYNSHFLLGVMGHTMYKNKTGKALWHSMVTEMSQDCLQVFEDGVVEPVTRQKFFGVCLGVKGDSPALAKIGKLNRTFQNLSSTRELGMCPYCLAGTPNTPWEDVGKSAAWKQTMWKLEPWNANDMSSLRAVSCNQSKAANLYKADPFHVFKYGIGRHFAGSCIVTLAQWNVWPGTLFGFDELMHRAYADFKWCCDNELERATPHIKAFTRQLLHYPNEAAFPWIGCKGGDTMLLLRWLLRVLRHGPVVGDARPQVSLKTGAQEEKKIIFDAMHDCCRTGLLFFRIIHESFLWRNREDCQKLVDCIDGFCAAYAFLASQMLDRFKLCRFHMEPALHQFQHLGYRLEQCLLQSNFERFLSPATFLCETGEDFVGRLARISRKAPARNLCLRSLQRYLIKVHHLWFSSSPSSKRKR